MIRRGKKDAVPVEPAPGDPAPAAPAPAPPTAAHGRSRRVGQTSVEPASVNLLSPWVLEELHVSRLRKRFAAGAVALVVALGLVWTGLTLQVNRTQEETRGEEAVAAGLSRQIADLSDVRSYVTTVENRKTTALALYAGQAQMSKALDVLDGALPRGAEFDSLTLLLAGSESEEGSSSTAGATCPGPDPYGAREVIGCVQLSGTADSRADVSRFVQDLANSSLFVEPFVDTTTKGDDRGVTFTGSVGLTPDARYAATLADDAAAEDGTGEEGSR